METQSQYAVSNMSPYIIPGLKSKSKVEFKSYEQRVLESFCSINFCPLEQIKGKRRHGVLVAVRQAFCLWAKENTKFNLTKIGDFINKDHATVLHSIKTAKNRIETKDEFFININDKCLSTLNNY